MLNSLKKYIKFQEKSAVPLFFFFSIIYQQIPQKDNWLYTTWTEFWGGANTSALNLHCF